MKNSTMEKLKEVMRRGEITQAKIDFMKLILDDTECPITVESNPNYFLDELEQYKFECVEHGVKTIIQRQVIPVYGKILYDDKVGHIFNNFSEVKNKPYKIDPTHNYMTYIEEAKTIYDNDCQINKIILDKKILVFFGQSNQGLAHNLECYIMTLF